MISAWIASALVLGSSPDTPWTPLLGCWSLVEDEVKAPLLAAPDEEEEEDQGVPPMSVVCLVPEGTGVRLQTFAGEEVFPEETLVADGQKHETAQGPRGNCRGFQELDWSKDTSLLFTRSELLCEEGRTRSITGISMLTDASTWVELQSIGTGEGRAVVIRRFRAAGEETTRLRAPSLTDDEIRDSMTARLEIAASALSLDDVVEASKHVSSEVVEALLLERRSRFPLDGESLIRLSDADVPPSVVDVMVALTFPDQFSVERGGGGGGMSWGYPGYDPFFDSAFAYPYYFAPFGYYYWYAPWQPIYVVPGDSAGVSAGRAVEGRGYTRVTRADSPDSGERRAHRRGESGSGSSTSSDGSSSGSSHSSGTVSHGGYSRSGGSSSGTARPKKQ